MRIRGILKDDIRTRSKLVERPAEQLDLLVHVLFSQGRYVELRCEEGVLSGDPALVMFVERFAERGWVVPVEPDGALLSVSTSHPETIVSLIRDVLEPRSVEVENGDEYLPAPI
jgi:hypothetical protein